MAGENVAPHSASDSSQCIVSFCLLDDVANEAATESVVWSGLAMMGLMSTTGGARLVTCWVAQRVGAAFLRDSLGAFFVRDSLRGSDLTEIKTCYVKVKAM